MKMDDIVNKGKAAAMAGYEKGNGLMDRIPALKSKRNKLIAWGALAAIFVVVLCIVFSGGGSGKGGGASSADGDTVRAASVVSEACHNWLCEKYGADSIKSYEFESLQWNENRAILKANVKIVCEPSMTDPSNEGFEATGTAVLYLEADDDDVNIVNFELQ